MASPRKKGDAEEDQPSQDTSPPKSSRKRAASTPVVPVESSPVTPKKPKRASRQSSNSKESVEETTPTPKKPQRASGQSSNSKKSVEETTPTPKKRATKKVATPKDPKTAANDRLSRARTERMIIIGHSISESDRWGTTITFDIVGSVGNIYKVVVKESPTCDCPDSMYRKNRCKHISYVLMNALLVTGDKLSKPSFTKEDVNNMLESPVLKRVAAQRAAENASGTRKPIEGECAICFMEMEARDKIVWCQFGCGNNLHDPCFKKWSKASGGAARCVYCRTPWEGEAPNAQAEAIRNAGVRLGDYVNVAEQFGMTGRPRASYRAYHKHPEGSDVDPEDDPEVECL